MNECLMRNMMNERRGEKTRSEKRNAADIRIWTYESLSPSFVPMNQMLNRPEQLNRPTNHASAQPTHNISLFSSIHLGDQQAQRKTSFFIMARTWNFFYVYSVWYIIPVVVYCCCSTIDNNNNNNKFYGQLCSSSKVHGFNDPQNWNLILILHSDIISSFSQSLCFRLCFCVCV